VYFLSVASSRFVATKNPRISLGDALCEKKPPSR
jgi:hypothetical protein